MTSPSPNRVSIFWHYDHLRPHCVTNNDLDEQSVPTTSDLVENIKSTVDKFGIIVSFKAYADTSSLLDKRWELQACGVSVNHCSSATAGTMITADMLSCALDNSPSSTVVVLISGAYDFAYPLSVLRMRRYRVILLAPRRKVHPDLKYQVTDFIEWQPPLPFVFDLPRQMYRQIDTPDKTLRVSVQESPHLPVDSSFKSTGDKPTPALDPPHSLNLPSKSSCTADASPETIPKVPELQARVSDTAKVWKNSVLNKSPVAANSPPTCPSSPSSSVSSTTSLDLLNPTMSMTPVSSISARSSGIKPSVLDVKAHPFSPWATPAHNNMPLRKGYVVESTQFNPATSRSSPNVTNLASPIQSSPYLTAASKAVTAVVAPPSTTPKSPSKAITIVAPSSSPTIANCSGLPSDLGPIPEGRAFYPTYSPNQIRAIKLVVKILAEFRAKGQTKLNPGMVAPLALEKNKRIYEMAGLPTKKFGKLIEMGANMGWIDVGVNNNWISVGKDWTV